jgi:ABC-2 type transport system permease protein
MKLSWTRVATIARREFLSTVRRKAFVFTIVGTPLLYAVLMLIVTKPQINERVDSLRRFKVMGVVDSTGVFERTGPRETETELSMENPFAATAAPPKRERFRTEVRFYPDFATADSAMARGEVQQVVVIPADYVESGSVRRYANRHNMFSSMDERVVSRWLVRGMLAGVADPAIVDRAARPLAASELYAPAREGGWELKDDRRELMDFLMPFAFALMLGLCIVIGGQYMLQGVNEEKESRILESMLCTVTPEDLLAGKLLGLGAAGLTIAVAWLGMGAALSGPAAVLLQSSVRPMLILVMFAYFLLGYLFFSSLMTGIGAMASNMREAQQFSVWFTFLVFIPFYLLTTLLGNPNSAVAVGLSLFPPTAPVSMVLRLAAPGSAVPAWQVWASFAILAASAWLILLASAKVFRVGMLMYGKTPTLPEIVRWIRNG